MSIVGQAKNMQLEGHFRVRIDGFADTDFAECSELKAVVDGVEYKSGGEALVHKQPGHKVTFSDVTLKRGVCNDYDLYLWFSQVVQLMAAAAGADATGLSGNATKRNVEIVQLDNDGKTLQSWTLRCYPGEFSAGQWNADSKNVRVESLVLRVCSFDLTG